jgi:uncharacterized protein (TIGR03437 family)
VVTFTVTQTGTGCQYTWSSPLQAIYAHNIYAGEEGDDSLYFTVKTGSACQWTADTDVSWITISPTSGKGSGVVHAPVRASDGTFREGTIELTGASYNVAQLSSAEPNSGGTICAATNEPASAGGIASLYGTNLATGTFAATKLPLTTTLDPAANTTVKLSSGGSAAPITAPLFFVSPNQINFQMPWEILGQSQASLTVTTFGVTSAPVSVNLANPSPGIFSINQQGTGQGAIEIANTTILAAPAGSVPGAQAHPAAAGNYVTIYSTNLGDVSNRPADGAASPSSPLAKTVLTPTVTIGGVNAPVSFSGLAPGFVGLYQVNAQVPTGAPSGNAVPVILNIGGVASNTVTIAVQ